MKFPCAPESINAMAEMAIFPWTISIGMTSEAIFDAPHTAVLSRLYTLAP